MKKERIYMTAFVFFIIIALISLAVIFAAGFGKYPRNPKVLSITGGILGLFVAGGLFYASLFHSVPTKSEGVVTSYGRVIGTPYGPGSHLMAPWRTLNIVQDTIQSDSFFDTNGQGPDQQYPSGTRGYCITIRLGGMNSGCANVQLQTQVIPAAIPDLYANYSSYGPNLSQDVDQFVVKRELTTDLNRVGLVHRIDKDTTGLVVIAKTARSMNELSAQFKKHTVYRRYIALVWGDMESDEGTIEAHVGRNLRFRKVMDAYPEGDHGKEAITHYKVLERFNYVTLVELRLETGRTHQIRVHMKYIGHPLFNDPSYGGDRIVKGTVFTKYKQFIDNCFAVINRHSLHARELGFTHPGTKEWIQFSSTLPQDMEDVLEKWRVYTQATFKTK